MISIWEFCSSLKYYRYCLVTKLCLTLWDPPWTAAHQASLSFTISQSLLKLMSIELVKPSNHLILCRLLLQPSIFPSIRIFSNELGSLHQMANVLGLQLQHWSYLEGLISFRIDWFDLLLYRNSFVIHTCRYWTSTNLMAWTCTGHQK